MIKVIDNRTDEVLDEIHEQDNLLEAEHVQDAESKEETLDFVFNGQFEGVSSRNRLLIKDDDNEYREFVIENIEQTDEEIAVFANASYLEDLNNGRPTAPDSKDQMTTGEWVDYALRGTDWYPGNVEYNGVRSISWTGYNNPYELLTMISNRFEMTLRFRVEVEGNKITGRYVDMVKVNHLFNGKEIVRGKDLVEFQRTENTEELATALIALGPQPEEGKERLVEIIIDDEANEKINKQGKYNWRIYEPQSDDQNMTAARLRTLGKTELNKRKEPAIDYTITAINMEHLYGHEKVRLYDKVRIKDEGLNRYAEANTKKITRNLLDPTDRVFVFGDIVEYQRETLRAYFNGIINELKQRLENMPNTIDNILEIVTDSELFEKKISKSELPPENPQEGDFWLDISDSEVGVLYRWENGKWVKSSITQAEEIGAVTREAAMYESIKNTLELLGMLHSNLMNEYYSTMENEYFIDNDLKASLTSAFNTADSIYQSVLSKFNAMTIDTATMGRLMAVLEEITRYREALNNVQIRLVAAAQEIERYFALLQSQYSEEKYNEILNEVANKFGLEVVDGKLIGDAIFIENMNAIKKDLQDQLDAAKEAFEKLEIGGRNLILDSNNFENKTWLTFQGSTVNAEKQPNGYTRVIAEPGTSHITVMRMINELKNEYGEKELTLSFDLINHGPEMIIMHNWSGGKAADLINTGYNKRFVSTGVLSLSAAGQIQFRTATNPPENGLDFSIRNIQVEEGNVPTKYRPAPEDTDNKITTINQSLTNIEGRLASTIDKETFDLLDKTVTNQGTLLEQTATQVQSKAEKSQVDTINNKVTNQGTLLNQTAEQLSTKADKQQLDDLNGTVKNQGTAITQNSRDIALRAKTEDLNTLTGRVEKNAADVTLNAKEIATKVNNVTYQADKDGIVGRLSGAESSLTQQAKLIETKVGSTELTQAIDDMNVGGENLIPFADLPKDVARWTTWSSTNSLFTSTSYPDYVWVNDNTGAANGSLAPQSPLLTEKVIAGQEYTLSFVVTDMRNIHEDMRYCYMINNIAGEPNHFLSGVKRKEIGLETSFVADGKPMYLYYVTFKSEITANVKVLVGSRKITADPARYYLKHVKLEKGNKVTGFSLSTKGLEDRIVSHDTQFEQTDKQIALRATMTDVNKSDETLSRAISELVVSSTGGLKFNYDSNGRLASYSVGPDGIQFDGSKIRFRAQDSIMLSISAAQKAGADAQSSIDNLDLTGSNLVSGTNFTIKENVDRLDTPWGGASYTKEDEYLLVLNNDNAADSPFGLRTFRNDFQLQNNQEYTLSFEAYSNVNADENFTYVYAYRYGGSNQGSFTMSKKLIGQAGGSTGIGYNLYRYTTTFKNTTGTTPANLLIATRGTGYVWFRIKNIMLQRGSYATPYQIKGTEMVDKNSLIPAINGDTGGWTISGRKIDLIGDVNITNGKTVISDAFINNVRVKYLYSSSENNNLQLTSSGMIMRNGSGTLDIGTGGIVYRDTAGRVRYQMDPTYISSAAMGTTNANIYLATTPGYEVRFVDVSQVPSDGLVNSYRYVDYRGKVGYVGGLANNSAITTHLDLGADGEVRIMNNGRTTYGAARAAAVYAHSFNWSTSGNDSSNLYIRPSSAGEVRFTAIHTTDNYSDIRAARVYSDSVWSHRFADYWIRVDGEVILSAHGSTSNFRDIRGMYAKFDALDVNTGAHIYTRPHGASSELRVTARGTTDQYRDIRFRNWTSVSSEIYKTDIHEWDYNVLDIIKDEIKIYQYKYIDDVAEGDNVMYQRGMVLERETPSEFIKGDGINQYEVTSWTLKGLQEAAHEIDALKEENEKLKTNMSILEKRLTDIEKMLK